MRSVLRVKIDDIDDVRQGENITKLDSLLCKGLTGI